MKAIFSKFLFAGLAAIMATAAAAGADIAPDQLAKTTTEEVLTLIRQDKELQSGNQKKLLSLVEAKVLPHFDFIRMTRLAVGKNWRQATPAQQQSLVNEFRTLLVRTYTTAFRSYKNQTVEFKPFKMAPEDTDVTVKTQIIQPGAQPLAVDYSMQKTPAGWKVYDVVIEGVSLVTNYRGTFTTEIQKSGIDGLIQTLAEKNRGAPPPAPGIKP